MSDDDVVNVADNWKARGKPEYIESILESPVDEEVGETGGSGDLDERFDEVVAFVQETGITSASGLQRHLRLGFNRAARIMDQLCEAGIVGGEEGTKPRKILMTPEEFEQYIQNINTTE